jgi:hypothetical protein
VDISHTGPLALHEHFGGFKYIFEYLNKQSKTIYKHSVLFWGDMRVISIFGANCMGIEDDKARASANVGAL